MQTSEAESLTALLRVPIPVRELLLSHCWKVLNHCNVLLYMKLNLTQNVYQLGKT